MTNVYWLSVIFAGCSLINRRLSFFPRNEEVLLRAKHGIKIINDSTTLIANRRSLCCHKNTLNNRRRESISGGVLSIQTILPPSQELNRKEALSSPRQLKKDFFFIKTMIWCLLFQSCKTKMNVFDKQKNENRRELK